MSSSLLRRRRRAQPDLPVANEDEPSTGPSPDTSLQAQWTGGSALATKGASGLLWAGLAAGPVALLLALSSLGTATVAARPVTPAVDRAGEQATVTEFAGRLVALWLRGVRGQEAQLAPLVHDVQVSLPTVGWAAGPPTVADVHRLPDGTWTVVTAVAVAPATSSAATSTTAAPGTPYAGWPVRYFSIPVHLDTGGPVALALPAPVAGPGAAIAPPDLGYRYQAATNDPIGVSVAQFLAALLSGTGDVSRYLSPGTAITAITPAPYTAIAVTTIATDRELTAGAAVPADRTHVRALVTATATAGPEQDATVQYALTLTVRGGRWEVTAIDPEPALQPTAPSAGPTPTRTPPGTTGTSPAPSLPTTQSSPTPSPGLPLNQLD